MLLNRFEFLLMNNPVRALIQEKVEVQNFRKLSSLPAGKEVLEIGCGNGNGTRLIQKYFSPKTIHAIDLDERMIQLAQKRKFSSHIHFETSDAAKLRFEDGRFDAVFDFGIIHHIPNWKDCLNELKRVLKFGGELLLEELSLDTFETFSGRIQKKLLDHPYDEMFRADEFANYLKEIGFNILQYEMHHPFNLVKYFVVVAKK